MNRIRRLVGLQTIPAKRLDGWLAPAAAMLAVAVVLSAGALARPVETEEPASEPQVLAEVQEPDVVSVLEAMDAEEAPLFRTLRDAGLNDRMLVMVLRAMEPDPEVLRAVQEAGSRRAVARRLQHFHQRIQADLEAGRITEQEAQERLERMQRSIHERRAAGLTGSRRGPLGGRIHVKQDLERIRKRVQADLEAGVITEQEAKERLEQAKARVRRIIAEEDVRQKIAQRIAEKIETVHAEIEKKLAAGVITEEEARQQLEQMRQEIHERIAEHMHGRWSENHEAFMDKMRAVHEKIKADLEAGVISEEEARQQLDKARQELFEQFQSQRDEPRPPRRRPDAGRHRGAPDKPRLDL